MQDEKQEAAEKVAEQPQPSHKEEPKQAPQAEQAPQEQEPELEQKSEAASQPARPHKRGQGERYTDIPNSQVGVHP